MAVEIRTLGVSDAQELVRLRRQALVDAPLAFLASPEDDSLICEETVRDRLRLAPESVVYGALAPRLVAMLGLYRAPHRKAAHKGMLWGMFVDPAWRRQRLGEQLLHAAIEHARGLNGMTALYLSVSEAAAGAKRLYERVGFTVWGVESEAIQARGRFVDDFHMVLRLPPQ